MISGVENIWNVFQRSKYGLRSVRFASSRRRVTVKPADSRKTFLIDSYKDLMDKNPVVLFAHHNNLIKQENAHFRALVKDLGGRMTVIRNDLFQVYLRNAHLPDPCAPVRRKLQNRAHPLSRLFQGPTAAISFPETNPAQVGKLLKQLEKSSDKLFIVGAKVESEAMDLAKLNQFKLLPTKPELQSQLLGLLHILSGAGLVRTLEAGSQALFLTLSSHHDHMSEGKETTE
ncbi:LAMI_0B05314g1_1 [Lachancea mirantina]|uniref:LAMI_0B05314g1_1 n=1 Tax=Lachancea mirantina TaxID=1230905 RepID=A0A1G4IWK3_9SACH|nr:LAMI_0B05314g1_1 [Lachancea mirantina]